MPRSFAKLLCSTWQDDDFLALSDQAMVLYWSLVAQPDISAAGIVALTERRWRKHLDGGLDAVHQALDELAAGRYILVDDDTAEVWVRSFIKHDGRLDNYKLAKSVHRAVGDIRSTRIRDACCREYPDVGPSMADRSPIEPEPPPQPVDNSETPGGRAIDRPSNGDRCTEASSQEPEPRASSQQPATRRHPDEGPPGTATAADQFTEHVIDAIVGLRLRSERGIRSPARYRAALRRDIPTEHGARIIELHQQFPTAAASSIAAAVLTGDTRTLAPHARTEPA